jgi:hypothetical protein
MMHGERVLSTEINNRNCPFIRWVPETMQMLFRISSFVPFTIYALENGDDADIALMHYTHLRISELIALLEQSFDIVEVKGYSIPEFCKELKNRQ